MAAISSLAHELGLVLRKLSTLSPEDYPLPDTPVTITKELISLDLLEDKLISIIKDRRSCLLAGALRLATRGPIHALPPEILVDIFFFATAFDCKSLRRLSSDPLPWGILHLSHVCREWRSLILGTSALWTRIVCSKRLRPLIFLYAERARNQPLDFIFVDDSVDLLDGAREMKLSLSCSHVRSISWRVEQQPSYGHIFGLFPSFPK